MACGRKKILFKYEEREKKEKEKKQNVKNRGRIIHSSYRIN